jgi:hypothetical protein
MIFSISRSDVTLVVPLDVIVGRGGCCGAATRILSLVERVVADRLLYGKAWLIDGLQL